MNWQGNPTLNEFLQPANSPVTSRRILQGAIQAEGKDDYQGKAIRLSNINLENAVEVSSVASASGAFNAFAGGSAIYFQSALTPNRPYNTQPNLAIPFISIYLGTVSGVGTAQIYPMPASDALAARFRIYAHTDYQATQLGGAGTLPFTFSVLRGMVLDLSGTTSDSIIVTTKWKALRFNISQKNT